MKNKSFVYVVVFIPLLLSVEAQATIYKCTNVQAAVYYNDKPCPVTDIERKIKVVKDPVGGYIPAPYSPSTVAEEGIQKPGKKGLVVGGDSTNKDASSKKETQAGESSENSLNSASTNTSDDKKNPVEGANSKKVTVALGNGSNSNAPTSNSEMNNHVGIH